MKCYHTGMTTVKILASLFHAPLVCKYRLILHEWDHIILPVYIFEMFNIVFFLLPPLCKCSYQFFHSSYHSLRIAFCGYFFLSLSLTEELPKNENTSIHVPTTSLKLKHDQDSWYFLCILSRVAPCYIGINHHPNLVLVIHGNESLTVCHIPLCPSTIYNTILHVFNLHENGHILCIFLEPLFFT